MIQPWSRGMCTKVRGEVGFMAGLLLHGHVHGRGRTVFSCLVETREVCHRRFRVLGKLQLCSVSNFQLGAFLFLLRGGFA